MSNLKTYKFSDLYKMSSGISSKPAQAGHGYPFVSFSVVFNNQFLPTTLPDLMDTSVQERVTYSVQDGDIFLTRTSETLDELAMSSVVIQSIPNATYSGFLKRLRPKQNNVTYHKFMAFYLRSRLFRKTMENNAVMTLRASLNEQIFSYLDLLLPEYSTQKKIGDYLYLINQKIELNNKINAELEAMAKLIYDYWFVQFDFPDDNGKPYKSSGGKMVYNEELKRDIPEGWQSSLIDDLLKKNSHTIKIPKTNYKKTGKFPVVDQSREFIAAFTDDINSSIKTNEPVIIFGDHTRVVKLVNFDFARGADGTQVLISGIKNIPQHFFYHALLKIDLSNYGYARHFKFLKQSRLVAQNYDIAIKYENIARNLHNLITNNRFESMELAKLRDWLLPMLMNGQVTVKNTDE